MLTRTFSISKPREPIYTPPENTAAVPIITFDLDGMIQKAEDFTKDEYVHEYILQYIIDVLNAKPFIDNPRSYIDAWKKSRRTCETYKHSEDVAMAFFDKHFTK